MLSFASAIADWFRDPSSTPSTGPRTPLPNTTHASNLATFFCLSRPTPTRPALPPELILQILAHPTRWLLTHVGTANAVRVSNKDLPIITLPPFTTEEIKSLRRIIFRFRSKDQGHSWDRVNHGTYGGSWTWFEAVVRSGKACGPDGPDLHGALEDKVRKKFELQRNRHAGMRFEDYEIVFEDGDVRMTELKSLLSQGDVLELRACARYPAWVNNVDEAKVEVWCLDDLGKRR
ncbi:MAG: hypothetical protein Q9215_005143 [Flavoplaca cf. flavocitrina]